MEDKIKEKEWVRTVDGKIGIFNRYSSRKEESYYKSPFNCFVILQNRKTPLQCCRDYILKHSPNITKVLETGDIIEHKIFKKIFKSEIYITNKDEIFTTDGERILPEEIISVETHEMFNQVKYEV